MKSNKETILDMYFIEHLKPVDIAKELSISKSAVTQVLQKDDRYMAEKERRKGNWHLISNFINLFDKPKTSV